MITFVLIKIKKKKNIRYTIEINYLSSDTNTTYFFYIFQKYFKKASLKIIHDNKSL